ncbi:MAG: hypothetical protein HC802_07480 [Caldilineaceae bacterium]|nr:hypothetical protein [Caldilineaceae bacterium]
MTCFFSGIVGGSVTAAMGGWRGGKAANKLWRLRSSKQMLSPEGDKWRARIKDREKAKLALNALKVIGGALGIAAGALVIGSNPVGWAIGIASAATVGGLVAYKLYTKYKKKKRKAKELGLETAKQSFDNIKEPLDRQPEDPDKVDDWQLGDYGRVWGTGKKQDETPEERGGEGQELQEAQPEKLDATKRKEAKKLGDVVAKNSSKSATVAWEIRQALGYRGYPGFTEMMGMLDGGVMTPEDIRAGYNKDQPYHKKFLMAHDALVLLGILKLTPEQVESESGQELVEKKLSATSTL